MKSKILIACIGGIAIAALECAVADIFGFDSWAPERRRTQFQSDSGYAVFPYVFDLPGIGSGYGVLGAVNNIAGTYTDVAGTFFEGDASGQALGADSIHLIPKTLILDCGAVYINRLAVQSYDQRGMDTDENDFSEAELNDMFGVAARLTATFLDRRVEGFVAYYGQQSQFVALRDTDGKIIVESQDAASPWAETYILGGRLDLTDDYMDPRKGIRFEPSIWWSPPAGNSANYFFVDASVSAYMPIGKRNTLAFNYLCSDAHVLVKGETDPYQVAKDEGLDYANPEDPREVLYIDNIVAENTYGSATSLGGLSRLRSYSEGRYRGAHTQFFGVEYRWNITDEVKPFDLFFVKDVRTAIQVAPFYEIGTTVDHASELWSVTRSSYGVGLRVVTGSGLIYRLDLAYGDEGFEPCIFFQYPWEL